MKNENDKKLLKYIEKAKKYRNELRRAGEGFVRLTVSLPGYLRQFVRRKAKELGVSQSIFIQAVLTMKIEDEK